MVAGAEAIAGVLGFEPRLYRAPYGRFVPATLAEAERRGWTCVHWSALGERLGGGRDGTLGRRPHRARPRARRDRPAARLAPREADESRARDGCDRAAARGARAPGIALARGERHPVVTMERPRLLLVPMLTELEWVIKPAARGMGRRRELRRAGRRRRAPVDDPGSEATARRGLEEVDRRGWDRFVVVADEFGAASRRRTLRSQPGPAPGHRARACARVERRRAGPGRRSTARCCTGIQSLLRTDPRTFVRQMFKMTGGEGTAGGYGEALVDEFAAPRAASRSRSRSTRRARTRARHWASGWQASTSRCCWRSTTAA